MSGFLRMVRYLAFLMALLLCTAMVGFAAEDVLFDDAGLLEAEEAVELRERLAVAAEQAGFYCGVMTTNDVGGISIREYCDRFYHNNSMGTGEERAGIMIGVAMDIREVYIYTYGDSVIALYNDARIDSMLDSVAAGLGDGNYAAAFAAFIDDVLWYEQQGLAKPSGSQGVPNAGIASNAGSQLSFPALMVCLGIAVGAGAIACAGVYANYKLVFVRDSYPFRQKGSLQLTECSDVFIGKHVTSRVIQQNNGGNRPGGGSTTHSSVGGGRHGGGGRKF